MAKNIITMRPVLVWAHNAGNPKAISTSDASGFGIPTVEWESWTLKVAELRKQVEEYVGLKWHARAGHVVDEKELKTAYNRIFPLWKNVVEVAKKNSKDKLHVMVEDLDELVGFCYRFTCSANGTVPTFVNPKDFRLNVEKLVGCIIAKLDILTATEGETLDEGRALNRAIESARNSIENAEGTIKELEITLKYIESVHEVHYAKDLRNRIEEQNQRIADANKRIEEYKEKLEAMQADIDAINAKIALAK